MKKKYLNKFLNRRVAVGVPHETKKIPFFYFGTMIDLTNEYLVLEIQDGVKQIFLKDIIEVQFND
jgi:hypothetical protein